MGVLVSAVWRNRLLFAVNFHRAEFAPGFKLRLFVAKNNAINSVSIAGNRIELADFEGWFRALTNGSIKAGPGFPKYTGK